MWAWKSSSIFPSTKQKIICISTVRLHHAIHCLQLLDAGIVIFIEMPIKKTQKRGLERAGAIQHKTQPVPALVALHM